MTKKLLMLGIMTSCLFLFNCSKKGTRDNDSNKKNTISWFNATYAPLTDSNDGDFNLIGGFDLDYKDVIIDLLKEWWDINNREDLEETITSLGEGMHNPIFVEQMANIPDIDAMGEAQNNASWKLIINAYKAHQGDAFVAWDLSRAINLACSGYVAGYYSKEEALDRALPLAKTLQSKYSSWLDMFNSYLAGYMLWSEDFLENGELALARKTFFDSNINKENSPYAIDWNLELKKEW